MTDAVRIVFDVTEDGDGERLDKLIAGRMTDISRSYAQQLMRDGDIFVSGEVAKPARRVRAGDKVEILLPPVEEPANLSPEYIPIPIIYEDDNILVFDKPAGLVTHPAPGHEHGTLVNAIQAIRPDHDFTNDRLGVVHRLDKDTSGLIVAAKNERSRLQLLRQWQSREVTKWYTALVKGVIKENEGTVDAPIGRDPHNRKRMAVVRAGRHALTHFKVRERYEDATLLDVNIETGRTHQIRVHCAFIGHPIVGDSTYGGRRFSIDVPRQFLHASYLQFELPDGAGPVELETPLPPDLQEILDQLDGQKGS